MDASAPLADLHAAAVYVSERLKAYVSEEDGYIHGVGIPHAFAGSWEVRALSEGLGGGIGEGFEASRTLSPDVARETHPVVPRIAGDHLPHARIEQTPPTSVSCAATPLPLPDQPCFHLLDRSPCPRFPRRLDLLFRSPSSTLSRLLQPRLWIRRERILDQQLGRRGQECGTALSPQEWSTDDRHRRPGRRARLGGKDPDRHITGRRVGVRSTFCVRAMTIDARSCLLRYGPRKLYAPTSAGNAPLWEIMDLPFLSPTEFVRAKLRCNREYWDLGDISWMVSSPVKPHSPVDRER